MALYSAALAVGLLSSAPWWLLRMATTHRYREGLGERLGRVPQRLRAWLASAGDAPLVWVHAVSVGEVLAGSRLIEELGAGCRVVISTTTRTGQELAKKKFGEARVFYFPLDFAFTIRAYLRLLRPAAVVLMESEIWPRFLHECNRATVPVAVVNARVSDRSFARSMKFKSVWGQVLAKVTLWLAQSEEDARRLVALGARRETVHAAGNLKYDVRAPKYSRVAELIKEAAAGRQVIVAGSTVGGTTAEEAEEEIVLNAWQDLPQRESGLLLVIAPRHPERFAFVETLVSTFYAAASKLEKLRGQKGFHIEYDVIVLDTIGDLAAVYEIANVAFVGGSLIRRGGHNPLEPAQFGIPIVIGDSYENFRDVTKALVDAQALKIVSSGTELSQALSELLSNSETAKAMGAHGRAVFEAQQGATLRAVDAILALISRKAVTP